MQQANQASLLFEAPQSLFSIFIIFPGKYSFLNLLSTQHLYPHVTEPFFQLLDDVAS